MRCMNCYQEIPDSCKFCPNCGAKQPVQKMEPVSQVKEETTDNITEDTAEVQQPTEKVQSEEDVLPEEKVQPEEDVQPTEPTQPADVAGSYQNDPYKSVNQEQNTSYGEPTTMSMDRGMVSKIRIITSRIRIILSKLQTMVSRTRDIISRIISMECHRSQ